MLELTQSAGNINGPYQMFLNKIRRPGLFFFMVFFCNFWCIHI
jgi:hypothetical protein